MTIMIRLTFISTILLYSSFIDIETIMFKKNPNRPPITINLKKVPSGYRVVPNESFNPFSFKKITRAIFKNDLQNSKGPEAMISGVIPNSSIIQPPSHITIPVSAQWFDYDKINEIEKQFFPEFFLEEDEQGKLFKKSPRLYKFYRNFMITLWRENSKKYLSPSVCRRNLPGDVSAIIRIHAFLQHWGLINFPSKQHSKGYVGAKSIQYSCHICQQTKASQYFIHRLDQETLFCICNCCYHAKIYPYSLKSDEFTKIIPKIHSELKKKKMNSEQINKMLEVISSENLREKDLWNSLGQIFPQYTKQEIVYNFLQIPLKHKMNANIFSNNEDMIIQKQGFQEDPTIFQDYENQQQLSIAVCYYLWRTQNEQNSELNELFEGAELNAKKLGEIEKEKCSQFIRVLIDMEQSKLEFKTMFIKQLQKLAKSQTQSFHRVAANIMAEEIKNAQISLE